MHFTPINRVLMHNLIVLDQKFHDVDTFKIFANLGQELRKARVTKLSNDYLQVTSNETRMRVG